MAGVRGKSGGPRPNSGGARPGAGRKPKAPAEKSANASVKSQLEPQAHGGALRRKKAAPVESEPCDMLTLLQKIALGQIDATAGQIRAAIAAVQYTHTKKGDGGKKEEDADRAKKAGAGKFAPAAPPRLAAAGGKKV
jgi:phage terminase small subunit